MSVPGTMSLGAASQPTSITPTNQRSALFHSETGRVVECEQKDHVWSPVRTRVITQKQSIQQRQNKRFLHGSDKDHFKLRVKKQVEQERERLIQLRDPEQQFFPKSLLQVFKKHESIEAIQRDLADNREKTTMRLVDEMTQFASREANELE